MKKKTEGAIEIDLEKRFFLSIFALLSTDSCRSINCLVNKIICAIKRFHLKIQINILMNRTLKDD